MATGRVLRFDEFRGYGFIAPDSGGEDIFVHANDVLDEKSLLTPGTTVTFQVMSGERGLKASGVQVIDRAGVGSTPRRSGSAQPLAAGREDDEPMCDVLSVVELRTELTEALLEGVPDLTAAQLLLVRGRVIELARSHNWVEA